LCQAGCLLALGKKAGEKSVTVKSHWEDVYSTKAVTEVSWFRPHLETSMALIRKTGVARDGHIIDVGGGASTLVDDLLAEGYGHVTVLDVAEAALADSRKRLGEKASEVTWLAANVTDTSLSPNTYDVWHDRAVFHFLTEAADRDKYVRLARRSIKPGGYAVIATFGLEGPEKCSGLDVVRYSARALAEELGAGFALVESHVEQHQTPAGWTQQFLYCLFRREG